MSSESRRRWHSSCSFAKRERQWNQWLAAGSDCLSAEIMKSEFQTRFTVVLLVLLTAAAVVFAGLNFSTEHAFQIPYDGVVWDEVNGHLVASRVVGKGPGEHAGIKVGDQLTAVERQETA